MFGVFFFFWHAEVRGLDLFSKEGGGLGGCVGDFFFFGKQEQLALDILSKEEDVLGGCVEII